jgi:chorismate mutase
MDNKPKYYLVEASMLPEIFIKVTEAKELMETGQAATVAEAVNAVGISRSAFYKYKDSISPFQDMKSDRILTFSLVLRNLAGLLSNVLSVFAGSGANILSINQSIPANGTAIVTISADTTEMAIPNEKLISALRSLDGVVRLEVLGG